MLANVLNLCESDPDAGLSLVDDLVRSNPQLSEDTFAHFARAMSWGSKGLFQALRAHPDFDLIGASSDDLRFDLGIGESELTALQKSLTSIARMEAAHPNALDAFGSNGDLQAERKVDGVAIALEVFHPGRTQEILGKTKLKYFGASRILMMSENISSDDTINLAGDVWFSFDHVNDIVRTALVIRIDSDERGMRYAQVMFFKRLPIDWDEDLSIGDALGRVGSLYFFEDGTTLDQLPEQRRFDQLVKEMEERKEGRKRGLLRRLLGDK